MKKGEEGVVARDSGLLYKVLVDGPAGGKTPQASTPTECNYRGTTIDGAEFDSSYKRGQPATFAPNQVIKGWTEAMQIMKEGDKWELYIPSELAYGDRGAGGKIPGGAVLIFTLEMLKVKGPSVEL
jgi:FKBP-type peptidyl-prolyl cis-trans isomerase FklB